MNGEYSILRLIAATAAMVLGPIVASVALGGLQLGVYRLARSEPPVFPILVMRGMMLMLVLIAGTVFYLKFGLGEAGMLGSPAPH